MISPESASGLSYETWKLCAPPRCTWPGLQGEKRGNQIKEMGSSNISAHSRKLIEGRGVGEALTSRAAAAARKRGATRVESFIVGGCVDEDEWNLQHL